MKKSVVLNSDPRRAKRKGVYHPMAEYIKQRDIELKRIGTNSAGHFKNLSRKIERNLPRGMRETGDMHFSTTCCLLECAYEEQQV